MYVGQPIKAKINFIRLTAISSLKAIFFPLLLRTRLAAKLTCVFLFFLIHAKNGRVEISALRGQEGKSWFWTLLYWPHMAISGYSKAASDIMPVQIIRIRSPRLSFAFTCTQLREACVCNAPGCRSSTEY